MKVHVQHLNPILTRQIMLEDTKDCPARIIITPNTQNPSQHGAYIGTNPTKKNVVFLPTLMSTHRHCAAGANDKYWSVDPLLVVGSDGNCYDVVDASANGGDYDYDGPGLSALLLEIPVRNPLSVPLELKARDQIGSIELTNVKETLLYGLPAEYLASADKTTEIHRECTSSCPSNCPLMQDYLNSIFSLHGDAVHNPSPSVANPTSPSTDSTTLWQRARQYLDWACPSVSAFPMLLLMFMILAYCYDQSLLQYAFFFCLLFTRIMRKAGRHLQKHLVTPVLTSTLVVPHVPQVLRVFHLIRGWLSPNTRAWFPPRPQLPSMRALTPWLLLPAMMAALWLPHVVVIDPTPQRMKVYNIQVERTDFSTTIDVPAPTAPLLPEWYKVLHHFDSETYWTEEQQRFLGTFAWFADLTSPEHPVTTPQFREAGDMLFEYRSLGDDVDFRVALCRYISKMNCKESYPY